MKKKVCFFFFFSPSIYIYKCKYYENYEWIMVSVKMWSIHACMQQCEMQSLELSITPQKTKQPLRQMMEIETQLFIGPPERWKIKLFHFQLCYVFSSILFFSSLFQLFVCVFGVGRKEKMEKKEKNKNKNKRGVVVVVLILKK